MSARVSILTSLPVTVSLDADGRLSLTVDMTDTLDLRGAYLSVDDANVDSLSDDDVVRVAHAIAALGEPYVDVLP